MGFVNFRQQKWSKFEVLADLANLHSFQDPAKIISNARFSPSRNLPNPFKFNETAISGIFQRKTFFLFCFWKKRLNFK